MLLICGKDNTNNNNNKMARAIDINAVFWKLLEAIVCMKYDVLKETRLFALMNHWVVTEQAFILDINGQPTMFANANDLFYGVKAQLQAYGESEHLTLITKALKKMEGVIEEIEMCECFTSLQVKETQAASLDALLANLTLM